MAVHLALSAFSTPSLPFFFFFLKSAICETGTCCLLAGPTPIAEIGKAPEVPQPSKTCCLHESFDRAISPGVFHIKL